MIDDADFERERILKGSVQRINDGVPELFDLIAINSGMIEGELPLLCPTHLLFHVDHVMRFFRILDCRSMTTSEITEAKSKSIEFAKTGDPYWQHVLTIIENKLTEDDACQLIAPFNDDISSFVESTSLSDLGDIIATFDQQSINDLAEFQPFYKQLGKRLHVMHSTLWLDDFHRVALKTARKLLPERKMAKIPDVDTSFMTKTQRKFWVRVHQQEDGDKLLLKHVGHFFSMKHLVKTENITAKMIAANPIEGLDYWGDEEHAFDDRIEVPCRNPAGRVLPQYDAICYMGYDWNQYNRTKFNRDNPPPMTIRGYKFRIFYPNAYDKMRAPKFTIDKSLVKGAPPDPRYTYTAIVFEMAPYLPIAFRIVDKKWDTYRNNGYRCTYHQGVFTFQFAFRASLYYKDYAPQQLY